MTTEEFSHSFDTLLNSHNQQGSLGNDITLDEYEKSVFLTEAQEQIIIELYTGRNDKLTAFEVTEELRSNLRTLIRTEVLEESTEDNTKLSEDSQFFNLPTEKGKQVLFITYESAVINDDSAKCFNGKTIDIVPVTQDDFHRIMRNPFKGPNKRRALRLDYDGTTLEVVSKFKIKDYTIRYLTKPSPIILTNLDGLTIDGEDNITECELDSVLHKPILERAVALAVATRSSQSKS